MNQENLRTSALDTTKAYLLLYPNYWLNRGLTYKNSHLKRQYSSLIKQPAPRLDKSNGMLYSSILIIICSLPWMFLWEELQMVILAGTQAPPWDWLQSTSANANALKLYDQAWDTQNWLLKIKPYAVPLYGNKHSKHNSWSQSLCYTYTCLCGECI